MLGLAACSFNLMAPEESSINFKRAKVDAAPVVLPKSVKKDSAKKKLGLNFLLGQDLEMEWVLENVLETIAELESFNIVSGADGLNRQ
ncbi:hypothetical protein CJ030_MR5G027213 [Morella rubra]|uniref:Uncharacterized protein n=1 Tax=Morella rubra TaxID=262757 RepID=A0A6A1VMS6_9ROSI|nr:hypothetical protein CJ030_MR5G027213 [Morella rubra]